MYTTSIRFVIVFVAFACGSSAGSLMAGTMMHPPGLNPGDTYHLAFVTRDNVANATNSDINFYNAFVQAQANSGSMTNGLGLTWKAIASTKDVAAKDNAMVKGPVFLVDHLKIAEGFDDMWDGSLQNPLNKDQDGVVRILSVNSSLLRPWTGSKFDGTQYIFGATDETLGSGGNVRTGNVTFTDSVGQMSWISFGPTSATQDDHPLYALSEAIIVPRNGAVPEPASLAVWMCFAGVGLLSRNKRRKSIAA